MQTLFCDIETSGLEPAQGASPLAIGMIADDGSGLMSTADEFLLHITPTEEQWRKASPEALKVNGLTLEFLRANGLPLSEAIPTLCEWLSRRGLNTPNIKYVGQNPSFDIKFLSYFMGDALRWLGFPLDCTPVDNILLAKELVRKDKKFRTPNFKSASLSLALGVEPEPPVHNALDGTRAARRNYYALIARLNTFTRSR